MDFCLKSHWQLGALRDANRQGRKALEEKRGRRKYCTDVAVTRSGVGSVKEELCFAQPRLGNRKEGQCPQPLAFGPLV